MIILQRKVIAIQRILSTNALESRRVCEEKASTHILLDSIQQNVPSTPARVTSLRSGNMIETYFKEQLTCQNNKESNNCQGMRHKNRPKIKIRPLCVEV
ncbi:TPA: hypothetical protein DCW61_03600 [Candidatus Uhrbacteria bacterium]|nr:hypothetical protein [Candidatus Uhrbacteria bacterium]